MRNNFQELEEEEMDYRRGPSSDSYSNIVKSVNDVKFVGHMFDHFIPKVFRYFAVLLGAKSPMEDKTVSHKKYTYVQKNENKTK